jgi:hypothetical protein
MGTEAYKRLSGCGKIVICDLNLEPNDCLKMDSDLILQLISGPKWGQTLFVYEAQHIFVRRLF